MKLTIQALQEIFGPAKVSVSTYSTNQGARVRLINSNPEDASVPALYPNKHSYKKHLGQFENVKTNRTDYILGTSTRLTNRKTDLYTELIDIPLPSLGTEGSESRYE